MSGAAFSGSALLLSLIHIWEFTANVSHELKTPLQSIIGSVELLENDLVQPEDRPRFLGPVSYTHLDVYKRQGLH